MVLLVFVYNLPQLFPVTQPLLGAVYRRAGVDDRHRGGLYGGDPPRRAAVGGQGAERGRPCAELQLYRHPAADRDPQAFRISLPTLINEYITIIKLSSILSVVSLPELLLTGQRLYAQNFLVMETLLAVAVYYVMVVTVFTAVPGAGKSSRYSA